MFAGLLLALALALVLTANAPAQILYGSVVGNVTDQTGAVVPGVQVTLTNVGTSQKMETTSNSAGLFRFATVPGGTYELSVRAEGFRPFTAENVTVSTNSTTRLDAKLEVGGVAESVVVEANALSLQSDRAEVRAEVTEKTLKEVPIPPGRNYQQFFNTIPGFTSPRNAHSVPSNPSRSLQFEVNGTAAASNNVRLDGATQYNVWLPHVTAYVPALESIETVNVVTNSFDAEQGLAGGAAINVQIKSGTNDLHGSAFEYHNNNKVKARPFFLPQGERNPKLVFNQFGGTIGGPIVKNKVFYFVSYEGSLNREFAGGTYTVPTAEIRAGDMSGSDNPIYNPFTGADDGSGRIPFVNNQIPTNLQDPIALKLNELLPQATFPDLLTSNLYAQGTYLFDRHTVDTKVNMNLTDRLTSYVRFSYLDYNSKMPLSHGDLGGSVIKGGNPGTAFGNTYSATIAATYTVSPTLLIDGNFGYTLMDTNVEQPRLDENLGLDFLGIPGTNGTRKFEGGWPGFGISNYTTFGLGQSYMPYYRSDPQYQYVVNGNWTHGSHNVRFGVELSNQQLNHTQPEFYGGSWGAPGGFNFAGGPTQVKGGPSSNQYNSYATFLLGLPTRIGKIYQWPQEYNTRTSMQSLYIRDQWQVNRRLTLNFGTRWNYFPMPTRKDRGLERYRFPGAGDGSDNMVWVCGVGSVPEDCGVEVSKRLFAPSLGIAYRLTDTLVMRGGYGINIDPWNMARAMRTNHPLLTAQTVNAANSFAWAGTLQTGIPVLTEPALDDGIIPIPTTVVANTLDDKFERGYIQSWNFALQKSLAGGWVGQAGYVATRQIGVLGFQERNYGLPGLGAEGRIYYASTGRNTSTAVVNRLGNTSYDALQASLEKRFSQGYQMNLSYTYSKCMGLAGFNNSGDRLSIKIPEYLSLNRSLCGIHQTQRFTSMGVWELPFGPGKRWATDGIGGAVLGGWQFNGLLSLFSGNPFSVSASGTSLNAPENSQRADQVAGEVKKLGGTGRGQAFYDWTAFAPVTDARFGNAGFNSLIGPGVVNLDLGVFRTFRFNERVTLQFRAEAFNATNTPHFSNPSNNISNLRTNSDGTFRSGVFEVTGVRNTGREGIDERTFRFGLRLGF